MRDMILKAVAQPPKIFWAPVLPALLSAGIQTPVMFMAVGMADINPLVFVISIVSFHLLFIGWGVKEPHLSTMIQAFGQTFKTTQNMYPEGGSKFEP